MKQIQYEEVRACIRRVVELSLSYGNIEIFVFSETANMDGHKISLELRVTDSKPEYGKGEE